MKNILAILFNERQAGIILSRRASVETFIANIQFCFFFSFSSLNNRVKGI